jgi:hypothetical protein
MSESGMVPDSSPSGTPLFAEITPIKSNIKQCLVQYQGFVQPVM